MKALIQILEAEKSTSLFSGSDKAQSAFERMFKRYGTKVVRRLPAWTQLQAEIEAGSITDEKLVSIAQSLLGAAFLAAWKAKSEAEIASAMKQSPTGWKFQQSKQFYTWFTPDGDTISAEVANGGLRNVAAFFDSKGSTFWERWLLLSGLV